MIVVVVLIPSVIVLLLLLLLVLKLLRGLLLQQLLMAFTHDSDAIARASGAVTAKSSRTRTALATTGLDGILGS